MLKQLPLSLALSDAPRFDSFHPGPNAAVVALLKELAAGEGTGSLVLHGVRGTGKTHLLQAAAHQASERKHQAVYLPLHSFIAETPAALQGLESAQLLCLDDIEAALPDRSWALALLRLMDAVRARGGRCVLSAAVPPAQLAAAALPDLGTRLTSCAVFGLKPLDDADLSLLLQTRARLRGLELGQEVAEFLLRRLPRDIPALMAALDVLDRSSLSAQRRLTIPFVQQLWPALALAAVRTLPG
jgi:DnaA family protein